MSSLILKNDFQDSWGLGILFMGTPHENRICDCHVPGNHPKNIHHTHTHQVDVVFLDSCQDIQIVVLNHYFLFSFQTKVIIFYPTHQKQRDVLNGKSPVTLWFWRFWGSKTLLGRKAHHSWRPLSLPQYDRVAWNTLKSPPSFKWLVWRICHWADGLSKVSWDDGLVPPVDVPCPAKQYAA